MTKSFSIENNRHDLSVIERILPWTSANTIVPIADDKKHVKPVNVKLENKNEDKKVDLKEIVVEKEIEIKPNEINQPQSYVMPKIADTFDSVISENQNTPVLEMWNVIESVGIKRDSLDRVFRTDEAAVSELYSLIEKKLHSQREQDMIRRLKEHVEKLVKTKANSTPSV